MKIDWKVVIGTIVLDVLTYFGWVEPHEWCRESIIFLLGATTCSVYLLGAIAPEEIVKFGRPYPLWMSFLLNFVSFVFLLYGKAYVWAAVTVLLQIQLEKLYTKAGK